METAILADSSRVEYIPDIIGEGAMKRVYFTADKSAVICLYKIKNAAIIRLVNSKGV